jgi:hypothetical protein
MSSSRKLRKRDRNSRKDREWKRSGKFNRHHIKNKCRGGEASEQNLLIMDTRRHEAWHFLFQNMSFREVAELLLRTCEIKHEVD